MAAVPSAMQLWVCKLARGSRTGTRYDLGKPVWVPMLATQRVQSRACLLYTGERYRRAGSM